jgi:uncharacterized membrane protein HdeD (DUF308 family)
MTISPLETLGWIATGVFACSYAFRDPASLRKVQALAALLWIGYGFAIQSMPIIASNLIVATLALFSILASRRKTEPERQSAS